MMKFLTPGLLAVNLLISGAILGLAMSGQIIAPAMEEALEEDAEAEEIKQSFYYEIKPEIVVNFKGSERPRYMQVALTLVTYDEAAIEVLKLHSPVIRNDLLLLFSNFESGPLMTREGKDEMRSMALASIRKIMLARYDSEAVEGVFITRFAMQ